MDYKYYVVPPKPSPRERQCQEERGGGAGLITNYITFNRIILSTTWSHSSLRLSRPSSSVRKGGGQVYYRLYYRYSSTTWSHPSLGLSRPSGRVRKREGGRRFITDCFIVILV